MTQDAARQKPSVILCEAYSSLREGLELGLSEPYHLRSTGRIAELLTLLEATPPALLILDVDHQPAPYQVLVNIRSRSPLLPVLLLSREFTLEQQKDTIKRIGNVGFITKPFDLPVFLEKVQTLIQGYSTSPIRRRIVRLLRQPSA